MPVYQYECEKCERTLDMVMTVKAYDAMNKDGSTPVCPECHKKMTRVIGVSATIFKGGGWTPRAGTKPPPKRSSES